MNKKVLLTVAGVLILLGVVSFLFLNPSEPEAECASDPNRTSGFVSEEKDCAISIESYNEIREYETSAKPGRIIGLVLIVAGLVVGGVALVAGRKSPTSPAPPDGGAA